MSRREVSFPRRQPSVRFLSIAYCTLDTIPEARDIHNQNQFGRNIWAYGKEVSYNVKTDVRTPTERLPRLGGNNQYFRLTCNPNRLT
jgi:hypothetical protein